MIERYELVANSGGAGRFRGGCGIRREYRSINHKVTFSGQGERFVNRPWGIFGGQSGDCGHFELIKDTGEIQQLSSKASAIEVGPDTRIVVVTPGAGGYGNPDERDTDAIAKDKENGKIT